MTTPILACEVCGAPIQHEHQRRRETAHFGYCSTYCWGIDHGYSMAYRDDGLEPDGEEEEPEDAQD